MTKIDIEYRSHERYRILAPTYLKCNGDVFAYLLWPVCPRPLPAGESTLPSGFHSSAEAGASGCGVAALPPPAHAGGSRKSHHATHEREPQASTRAGVGTTGRRTHRVTLGRRLHRELKRADRGIRWQHGKALALPKKDRRSQSRRLASGSRRYWPTVRLRRRHSSWTVGGLHQRLHAHQRRPKFSRGTTPQKGVPWRGVFIRAAALMAGRGRTPKACWCRGLNGSSGGWRRD